MIDPDANETPERLKAVAIMAAFDALPDVIRAAIRTCDQQASPFRARAMLNAGAPAEEVAATISSIKTSKDLASFHQVTPAFATGTLQPNQTDRGAYAA